MELFSLFLGSAISGAIAGAVGSVINVLTNCPACSQQDGKKIGNRQNNILDCSNCHKEIEQFTNVCDFTVDPTTKRIGQVGLKVADLNVKSDRDFFRDGFLWLRKNYFFTYQFNIPIKVQLEGLNGRSIVLEVSQIDFENDKLLETQQKVIVSRKEIENFDQMYVPKNHMIKRLLETDKIIACDINVQSEYRDPLYSGRRLFQLER